MAYNSDGYIMIDFTEVDFRRTNQTIEGLYKRCVDVIGTNKFILVINANGRTPLPATCSFTNNQYVIDTCIYMFAISSNDNLFIRRNDVPASDIIDDSSISVDKTWSSNKIDSELDTKADASALADYQPLLTAVSPISISEDDEISVDLSSKQDVLTAGDNITILDDVISANMFKHFSYTGDGDTTENILTFPVKPKWFKISRHDVLTSNSSVISLDVVVGNQNFMLTFQTSTGSSWVMLTAKVEIVDDTHIKLTPITTQVPVIAIANSNNVEFDVYYI